MIQRASNAFDKVDVFVSCFLKAKEGVEEPTLVVAFNNHVNARELIAEVVWATLRHVSLCAKQQQRQHQWHTLLVMAASSTGRLKVPWQAQSSGSLLARHAGACGRKRRPHKRDYNLHIWMSVFRPLQKRKSDGSSKHRQGHACKVDLAVE
eukprot:m.94421 g.94421  ORF g.94421 m.94421 type:complete len:151 (-) comp15002_c0_seq43:4305-4757(-)